MKLPFKYIITCSVVCLSFHPVRSSPGLGDLISAKYNGKSLVDAVSPVTNILEEFSIFKTLYKRQYEEGEEQWRFSLFKEALELVLDHNKGVSSYIMGINEFSDLTDDEIIDQKTGLISESDSESIFNSTDDIETKKEKLSQSRRKTLEDDGPPPRRFPSEDAEQSSGDDDDSEGPPPRRMSPDEQPAEKSSPPAKKSGGLSPLIKNTLNIGGADSLLSKSAPGKEEADKKGPFRKQHTHRRKTKREARRNELNRRKRQILRLPTGAVGGSYAKKDSEEDQELTKSDDMRHGHDKGKKGRAVGKAGNKQQNTAKVLKAVEGTDIPKNWDWRDFGVVTIPRNQLKCGSCWSFSAATGIETYNMKRLIYEGTFDKNHQIVVSEQDMIDCSAKEFGSMGCMGGMPQQGWRYAAKYGVNRLETYKYDAKRNNECRHDPKNNVDVKMADQKRLPSGRDDLLEHAIYNYGPVSVAVQVSKKLAQYKTGIYENPDCDPNKINHAVVAIGFGEENGHKYFIIRNSWGPKWGEKGYFRISRRTENHCGISQQCYYPIIPNCPDTPDMLDKLEKYRN